MVHRLLPFIAALLLACGLQAQQRLSTIEYFLDQDPGLGQGVMVPVAGAVDTAITFTLPLDTLAFGVHTLYARTLTDSSRLSRTQQVTFVKLQDVGVEGFSQFEYFIDEDPGLGNGNILPAASDSLIDVSFTIDLNGYSPGLHTFYVRAKNAIGLWSFLQSHTFFLLPGDGVGEVVAYEYFIDDDPGIGAGIGGSVPAGDSLDYTFTADLSGVAPGIHTLYLRTKNGGGLWSFSSAHTFLVTKGSAGPSVITDLEYFFDLDPGAGNAQPIAGVGTDSINTVVPISLSGLTVGDHELYVRARDSQNDWSFLYQQTVTVTESDDQFPVQSVFPAGLNFVANDCFTPDEQGFHLYNTGPTVLNAQIITGAGYLDVSPGAISVFPNDSVFVAVTANPSVVGPGQYFGSVAITTNDPVNPMAAVSTVFTVQPGVFSTVLQPTVYDLGEVQINTTATVPFALTNTSCDTLDVFGVLSSLGFPVTFTPGRLASGEERTMEVSLDIDPTIVLGSFTDTLLIQRTAGTDSLFVTGFVNELPVAVVDSSMLRQLDTIAACNDFLVKNIALTNDGAGPLNWSWTSAAEGWIVPVGASGTVLAGETQQLLLQLDANALVDGQYRDSIVLMTDDPLRPSFTYVFDLWVDGPPNLSADQSRVSFGPIPRNTRETKTLTILNDGCEPIFVDSLAFGGNAFIANVSSVYLPEDFSYPVELTFQPAFTGAFSDTLKIFARDTVLRVALSGTAEGALNLEVSPNMLFDTIPDCEGMTLDSFFVYNTGDGPGTWSLEGMDAAPGWISYAPVSGVLAAGDSVRVGVILDAVGLNNATYTTSIDISSSDPLAPAWSVRTSMHLIGTSAPMEAISELDFKRLYYTTDRTDTIWIHNMACDTFEVLSLEVGAPFFPLETTFDLLPRDSFPLLVKVDPTQIGMYSDTLRINGETDTLNIHLLADAIDYPKIDTITREQIMVRVHPDIDPLSLADSTWFVWGEMTGFKSGSYGLEAPGLISFTPDQPFFAGEQVDMTFNGWTYSDEEIAQPFTLDRKASVTNATGAVFTVMPAPVDYERLGQTYTGIHADGSDLDSDGDLDLVVYENTGSTYQMRYFENTGSLFIFRGQYGRSDTSIRYGKKGDLDNDGKIEHLSYSRGDLDRYIETSPWNYSRITEPALTSPDGITIGDISADGDLDVLFDWSNNIYLLTNTDFDFSFEPGHNYSSGVNYGIIPILDFDKDGLPNIIIQNASTTTRLRALNYAGNAFSFNREDIYTTDGNHSTGILDYGYFDNNEFPDYILARNYVNNQVIINDTIQLGAQAFVFSGRDHRHHVGDIDGDGDQDLFSYQTRNTTNNSWDEEPLTLFLNDGNGNFTESQRGAHLGLRYGESLADWDGDGDLDFMFFDHDYKLWIAYNGNSNADLVVQDSLVQEYRDCSVDSTYAIQIANAGDSLLVWQVLQPTRLPSWLSVDTTYGQVPAGESLALNVNINTDGLESGIYAHNILLGCNDPDRPLDTLEVQFELISDTLLFISHTELDFGLADTAATTTLEVTLTNDGCEEVVVDGGLLVGSVFSTSTLPVTVPSFGTAIVSITLEPAALIDYTDTLTLTHAFGEFVVALEARGCYVSPVTRLREQVCEIDSVRTDSMLLQNVSGCDSLVLTTYHLPGLEVCPELTGYDALGEFEGHCYYLSQTNSDWNGANSRAQDALLSNQLVGYLASINTAEENEFLTSVVSSAAAYIGLEDGNGGGDIIPCESQSSSNRLVNCWKWQDGTTIFSNGFYNWYNVEPNNSQGAEDVGMFYGYENQTVAARGGWNDHRGNYLGPHIIEVIGANNPISFAQNFVCEREGFGFDTITVTDQYGCDSVIVERGGPYHEYHADEDNRLLFMPFDNNILDYDNNFDVVDVSNIYFSENRNSIGGSALYLNGSSHINLGNSLPNFGGSSEFTVSFWTKPESDGEIISRFNGNVIGEWIVGFSDGRFRFHREISPYNVFTEQRYNYNEWCHVIATYSNGRQKIYVNGEIAVDESRGSSNSAGGTNVIIGAVLRRGSLENFYKGSIDNLKIYNEGFDDVDALNQYNREQPVKNKVQINLETCNLNSIGQDTTLLQNQFGCDSTVVTVTSLKQAVNSNALTALYPMNGDANDFSGFGNHGIVNGASLTTDRFGNPNSAYLFDGSNNHILLPEGLIYSRNWTFNAFVLFDDLDKRHTIFGEYNQHYDTRNYLYYDQDRNGITYDNYQPSGGPQANAPVVAGVWQMVTYVSKNDSIYMYVDGEFVAREAYENFDEREIVNAALGARLGVVGEVFQPEFWSLKGKLDDVSIYNRDLTEEEIKQLLFQASGPTDLVGQDTLLNFGTLTTGDSATLITYLTNTTCDTLRFTNLSIAQPQFTLAERVTAIPPYGTVAVPITFYADEVLLYVGQLYVITATDTISVLLEGAGCIPRPSLVYTDTTALCTGQAFAVTTSLGVPVQWNTGEVAEGITVTAPGPIVASFSNNNGCQVFTDTVEVTAIPDGEVVITGFSTICRGDSTDVEVRNASAVIWSTGATTTSVRVSPEQSSWVSATMSNAAGCIYQDSVFVNVIDPTPPAAVTNMVPADGTTDASRSTLLSWLPDQFATTFDVYVWPAAEEKPVLPTYANLNQITITANNLTLNTSYNWQVHAKNSCNETPGPVQSFMTVSPPNLRVANIQVPNGAFSGTTVTISFEIINDGPGVTGPISWVDNVYLSEDNFFHGGGVDPLIGSTANVTALSAGQSYQSTITFTLPRGISGDYFIYVRTDNDRRVTESNEDDNRNVFGAYLAVTLTPPPDLQVTSILTPNNSFSGQTIPVTFTVTNVGVGQTISNGWNDRIGYSTSEEPGVDVIWGTNIAHGGALQPNVGYTVVTDFDLPANVEDTLYLHVQTDANDAVYEFINNGNNISVSNPIRMILTPPADLEPTGLQMVSDDVSIDEEVTLFWNVENIGGNVTEPVSWRDQLYFTRADTFALDSATPWASVQRGAPLLPDSMYSVVTNRRIPGELVGDYNLFLRVDATNSQFEFTDTNNLIGPIPFSVRVPDLALDSIICPDTLVAGDATTITIWARNAGAGDVVRRNVSQRVYLTPAVPFDRDSVIASYNSTHSGPWLSGDTSRLTMNVAFPVELSGKYFLYAEVNVNEQVFENGAVANNMARLTDTLHLLPSPKPDLVITSLASFDTLYAGTADTFSYVVRNVGEAATVRSYRNKLSFWRDGAEVALLADNLIGSSTAPFESYERTANLTVPAGLTTGYYELRATVDYTDQLLEESEANNGSALDSIYIVAQAPSDLSIIGADTLPDTLLTETTYEISVVVKNIGPARTVGNWRDQLVVSDDNTFSTDDEVLQTVVRTTGALAADSSYTVSFSIETPNNWPETPVFYILKTDVAGATNDLNPGNNTWVLSNSPADGPEGPDGTGGGGTAGGGSTTTTQSPIRDLAISILSAPNEVVAGQQVTVIYEVTNVGEVDLTGSWTDRLNLSPSPSPGGVTLASRAVTRNLAVDSSYVDTLTATVALNTLGNLYQVVRTDATNVFYEHEAEGNNFASAILSVEQSDPADLEVINVAAALDTVAHGDLLPLTWITKNAGQNPVRGRFTEAVYASADESWDVDDVLIGSLTRNLLIPALGQVNSALSVNVEEVPYGYNYFIIRTDIFDNIREDDEENNFTTGPEVFVDIALLPLDVLVSGVLAPARGRYFRTPIPDSLRNESMVIELTGDTPDGFNEKYVSYGKLPTRNDYDRRHQEPFRGKQSVVVPDIKAGDYFSLSYGGHRNNATQNITVEARIQPFELTRIDANRGANTGSITVRLVGARFEEGMVAYLDNDSLNTLLQALELEIVDPTLAYATFNLNAGAYIDRRGIDPGLYDVILVKADGARAVLADGFEVFEGSSEEVAVNVIYPLNIRPFRTAPITIEYQNTSGRDINVPRFIVISMDDIPIGRDENQIRSIDGWVWGSNVPRLYREVLVELSDPERPDSSVLRAGASGVITLYAWILNQGSYRMKIIEVQDN